MGRPAGSDDAQVRRPASEIQFVRLSWEELGMQKRRSSACCCLPSAFPPPVNRRHNRRSIRSARERSASVRGDAAGSARNAARSQGRFRGEDRAGGQARVHRAGLRGAIGFRRCGLRRHGGEAAARARGGFGARGGLGHRRPRQPSKAAALPSFRAKRSSERNEPLAIDLLRDVAGPDSRPDRPDGRPGGLVYPRRRPELQPGGDRRRAGERVRRQLRFRAHSHRRSWTTWR